jgi:ABC-type nickel/cobalt efflux system permease component RcnA
MKKIALLLLVGFGITALVNQASAQSKQEWPELKEFHKVMAQTFHPSEEGNLEPIKTRVGEMVQKAKNLQASKFPSDYDNAKMKAAVDQLVTDSQKLEADIKKGASDKKITKSLSGLHDVFHQIVGLCSATENHDHEHKEGDGHSHEGHSH